MIIASIIASVACGAAGSAAAAPKTGLVPKKNVEIQKIEAPKNDTSWRDLAFWWLVLDL